MCVSYCFMFLSIFETTRKPRYTCPNHARGTPQGGRVQRSGRSGQPDWSGQPGRLGLPVPKSGTRSWARLHSASLFPPAVTIWFWPNLLSSRCPGVCRMRLDLNGLRSPWMLRGCQKSKSYQDSPDHPGRTSYRGGGVLARKPVVQSVSK